MLTDNRQTMGYKNDKQPSVGSPTYKTQRIKGLRDKLLNIRSGPSRACGFLKDKRSRTDCKQIQQIVLGAPVYRWLPGLSFLGVKGGAFTTFGDIVRPLSCFPRPLFASPEGVNVGESTFSRFLTLEDW